MPRILSPCYFHKASHLAALLFSSPFVALQLVGVPRVKKVKKVKKGDAEAAEKPAKAVKAKK
jgi:hypothetical protein